VRAAIARAEQAIVDSGVHLGGLALTGAIANAMIERGYRMILTGFDVLLLQQGAAAILGGIERGD
jgi:4-hydroxy-2-oxoheptanedioate aldolase